MECNYHKFFCCSWKNTLDFLTFDSKIYIVLSFPVTHSKFGIFCRKPPPSIASNFFGETNSEYSLQVSFLFHPSVVGGFRVSFTKKKKKLLAVDGGEIKITRNRWRGLSTKDPKFFDRCILLIILLLCFFMIMI